MASGNTGSREHAVRDDARYAAHIDDVHFNPVKHGFAASPADWPYSIFGRCVSRGLYPEDWTGDAAKEMEAGEPGG